MRERRPIQKRGGYQPVAHGPAPTEPPPKPRKAVADPSVVDALNTLREFKDFNPKFDAALAVVETALADYEHLRSEYHYDMDRGDHLVYVREWDAFNAWQRGDLSFEARAVAAEAERDTLRRALERILHEVGSVAQSPKDAAAAANRIARAVLAGEEPT